LLDEPTNHLDFETVEALGRALKRFEGTVFFISHDRTFVNLVANHILEVKNGRILRYPGTYEDYVYFLESAVRGEDENNLPMPGHDKPNKQRVNDPGSEENPADPLKEERKKEQDRKKEELKLRRDMAKAEQKMNNLAKERDKALEEIRTNPFYFSKERNKRLKELQLSLERAEDEWCALQTKLDQLT